MIRDYTGQPGALGPEKDEATLKPSHRATTSSRTPGKVNRGTVWTHTGHLVRCADCGAAVPETLEPGRHAPRRIGSKLVNCVGRVLE
jgi:hypothetical protein